MFLKYLQTLLSFSPSKGIFCHYTNTALVEGINNTTGFIHPIHNVSLGNWWRFDHISNLLPHGKRRKQENITFLPCWENSVTEVMFLPGIGGHLKISHMDPRVSFGNQLTNLSVRKRFFKIIAPYFALSGPFLWGRFWKRTVGKRQITSTSMHHIRQETWGRTWKRTVEESKTNAKSTLRTQWSEV